MIRGWVAPLVGLLLVAGCGDSPGPAPSTPAASAPKAPFVFSPDYKRLAAVQNVGSGGKSLGWINSGTGGFESVALVNDPAGWETIIVPLSFGFNAKGEFIYGKRRGPGAGDDQWHAESFAVGAGKPANSGERASSTGGTPDKLHFEFERSAGGAFMTVITEETWACQLPLELDRERTEDRAVFYFFARVGQMFKSPDWCSDKGSVAYKWSKYGRIFNIVSSPCGDRLIFRATDTFGGQPYSYIADTDDVTGPDYLRAMNDPGWPPAAWGFYRWVTCP